MKDIKHIRRDNHSVPWVMPQDLRLGGAGGQKFNFLNMVMWHITLKGMRGSRNFRQVQVSRTKKKSDNVFFFFFFFLVLSLFYRYQMVNFKEIYQFFKVPEGVQLFPGGVQLLIPYRNPYNFPDFEPRTGFLQFYVKTKKVCKCFGTKLFSTSSLACLPR